MAKETIFAMKYERKKKEKRNDEMKWNAVSQNSNHCRLDSGGRWALRRRQHIEYIVIRKSKRKSIMFFHIFPYPQVEFNEFLGYFFFVSSQPKRAESCFRLCLQSISIIMQKRYYS